MRKSVIYQDIRESGKAQGREEGRREEAVSLIPHSAPSTVT